MNVGGCRQTKLISACRYAGLLFPILLAVYGSLVQSNMIISDHHIDMNGLVVFYLCWALIGIVQFLHPAKSKSEAVLMIIAYHLLLGAYLVFVSGFISPIVLIWLILAIAAYNFLGKKGVVISLTIMLIFIFIDIFLWNNFNLFFVLNDLIAFGIMSILIFGTLLMYEQQKISKEDIEKIKSQGLLERDRISTLINNMTDAVISADEKGIIRIYNAATLNLLDTNNDLKGHIIDEIMPLTDKDNKKVSLLELLTSSKKVTKRDDLFFSFGEDDKMRLEITYSPIRSSYGHYKSTHNSDGFIVLMRDITKSKSLEEERDEFISVVSHELRTPIAITEGTISNVQVMIEHKDITQQMLRDSLKTAHDQIIFLAGMVNDLSTLSRAERGVMSDVELIDVRELAHKMHDKFHTDAHDKKLKLNLDLSAKLGNVSTSRLYIEEILQNFITNAIKYTKEGSVTIQFKQKDDVITFAIKDTGIGISKSDQNKVFQKFFRSEDYRTRETSGTGLGLYIAHKLASKIGTKIEFRSRLNFGSTFSFSLPISDDKK